MKSLPINRSTGASRSGRKLALAWSATEEAAVLKVAFATNDRVLVNQHFGAAAGFAIYDLAEEWARLVEVIEFPVEAMDGNEGKLVDRISALSGCAAVYCLAVGGSAVRQLLALGIQPVRLDSEVPIDEVLLQLRKAIHEGNVMWINKHLRQENDDRRFERMAEEGWQE